MESEEKRFWVGITVFATLFGVGGYVVFEHSVWGWIFMVAGLGGLVLGIVKRVRNVKMFTGLWLIAILMSWAMIGYDIYDHHHFGPLHFKQRPMERVYGKHFVNQEVEIDNRFFDECTFKNVTFLYHGTGGTIMKNTREKPLDGTIALKTDNQAAFTFSVIQNSIRSLPGVTKFTINAVDGDGNMQ